MLINTPNKSTVSFDIADLKRGTIKGGLLTLEMKEGEFLNIGGDEDELGMILLSVEKERQFFREIDQKNKLEKDISDKAIEKAVDISRKIISETILKELSPLTNDLRETIKENNSLKSAIQSRREEVESFKSEISSLREEIKTLKDELF